MGGAEWNSTPDDWWGKLRPHGYFFHVAECLAQSSPTRLFPPIHHENLVGSKFRELSIKQLSGIGRLSSSESGRLPKQREVLFSTDTMCSASALGSCGLLRLKRRTHKFGSVVRWKHKSFWFNLQLWVECQFQIEPFWLSLCQLWEGDVSWASSWGITPALISLSPDWYLGGSLSGEWRSITLWFYLRSWRSPFQNRHDSLREPGLWSTTQDQPFTSPARVDQSASPRQC